MNLRKYGETGENIIEFLMYRRIYIENNDKHSETLENELKLR